MPLCVHAPTRSMGRRLTPQARTKKWTRGSGGRQRQPADGMDDMNANISVPRDPSPADYRLDRRTDGGGRVLLSVVVPVFMEEANIRPLLARLEPVLETIGPHEII